MSYDDEIAALKQQEAFATAQGRQQNALDARRRIAMLREERARAKHPDTAPPASRSETADEDTSRVETATAADGDGRATKATARKRAAAKRRKTSDDG